MCASRSPFRLTGLQKIYKKCILCLENGLGSALEMFFLTSPRHIHHTVLIALLVFFSPSEAGYSLPMQDDVTEEVEPNKTTAKKWATSCRFPLLFLYQGQEHRVGSTRRLEMTTFS
jgi:hypothetical protein